MEVYADPMIKEMMIDGVFANPALLPTYNINFSLYPIDGASLALLKTTVAQQMTQPMTAAVPINRISFLLDRGCPSRQTGGATKRPHPAHRTTVSVAARLP